MEYKNIKQGYFFSRPNRFIAHVEIDGREEICHVKNTGRCQELLTAGVLVYLEKSDNPKRKTQYSLVAVQKGRMLVNMDSQAPNKVVAEWLQEKEPFGKILVLRPECRYGTSRFDFYMETAAEKAFIEVKGVTLEENGVVRFPDAPTERGIKHLQELVRCRQEGYTAIMIFVVQLGGARYFEPNRAHIRFTAALRKAHAAGVKIIARECMVTETSLCLGKALKIRL
ncbi:MAG: DNA/RNA nuclease SfsA [Phascolarctobacterium sp.]|nr:DNA/RNA nuclease SfsA [Phascolarctobacterium sp.]